MAQPPGQYPDTFTQADFNKEAVETAVELVPLLGPTLARIVGHAWTSHLEHRQIEWHNDVSAALVTHADRIEGIEQKLQSDEFLTLYIRASQAATETHEAETRRALRNAVVNAALEREDEDWSFIFIDLTARLRPNHLQLLAFAANPADFLTDEQADDVANSLMIGISNIAAKAFPEWTEAYFTQIKRDLEAEGLAELPGGGMSGRGALSSRITDKGRRFLRYINGPDPEDSSSE
jgi:hypothetical protein